ncbi:MAG: hypothetical protein ACRDHP_07365, partial [Ktedonobacterales bacterium]
VTEKGDIQLNIFSAPFTGLGFGQKFQMYIPLPDLSFWPFWHYETHNAILWVWMKDGIFGFMAFWWLMGRGMFDGGRAVETQREEWALARFLRRRFARDYRSRTDGSLRGYSGVFRVALRSNMATGKRSGHKHTSEPALFLNVPAWERSDHKRSVTAQRSGILALLLVSVCMIPAQVVYSYVDLGLTSERDMLLFGLMLGLIARGPALLGTTAKDEKTKRVTARKKAVVTPHVVATEEARELARRILLLPAGSSRLPAVKVPTSRPASRPLPSTTAPLSTAPLPVAGSTAESPTPAPAPQPASAATRPHSRPLPARAHTPASRPFARPMTTASPSARRDDEPPLPWEHPPGSAT